MREIALAAIDDRDFARAVKARDLQLRGEELAEQAPEWKRLAPDNKHRLDALLELAEYTAKCDTLERAKRTA